LSDGYNPRLLLLEGKQQMSNQPMELKIENESNQPGQNQHITNGKAGAGGAFPDWTVKVKPWPDPVDGRWEASAR
jgi:hypothetical protein